MHASLYLDSIFVNKNYTLKMDLKRVQNSPMQSPNSRGYPLIQPLVNIGKASTPVRTRVISNTGPLNSTPVKTNKIPQKRPISSATQQFSTSQQVSNKQNDPQNRRYGSNQMQNKNIGISGVRKNAMGRDMKQMKQVAKGNSPFVKGEISQGGNANFSPVLALNRKLKQGPAANNRQFEQSSNRIPVKTFSRVTLFEEQILDQSSHNQDYYQFSQVSNSRAARLVGSKQYSPNPNVNLQSSNSFKTLLESKHKTPPRLGSMAFTSLSKKVNSSNSSNTSLRNSLSANNILTAPLVPKNSQKAMIESRSHDRVSSLRIPKEENFLTCKNDEKRAKYKAVGIDNQNEESQMLVYCTDCARMLVNSNFEVEELTQQDIEIWMGQSKSSFQQLRSPKQRSVSPLQMTIQETHNLQDSLTSKIALLSKERQKHSLHFKEEMDKVDSFYNSVIELIEEQRVADRQAIIQSRDKNKEEVKMYESDLGESVIRVEHFLDILEGNMSRQQSRNMLSIKNQLTQHQAILQKNIHYPPNRNMILGDIQTQYDNFAEVFYNQIRLRINETVKLNEGMRKNGGKRGQLLSVEGQFQEEDQQQQIPVNPKQNSLRFSFEKLSGRNKSAFHPSMNTLTEENQDSAEDQDNLIEENQGTPGNQMYETYDDSYQNLYQNEKKPFRDIFFDEQSQTSEGNLSKPIKSPTFKQF